MQEEKIRLNKYMAQAGLCSRREADKLIGQGRVYVNGTDRRAWLSGGRIG